MDNFQTGTLAIFFTGLCIRVNNLIMELADSLLQPTMTLKTEDKWFRMLSMMARERPHYSYLLVIRAMVTLRQPSGFGIRYSADFGPSAALEGGSLALDVTDLETLILWPFEDLVAMETIERVGRVLAG
jgi:hypothetical protein